MKTACIVQGDIRDGLSLILNELNKYFDYLILSTWEDDLEKVPQGDFYLVLNKKPDCNGLSNRNYQRFSVSRGIDIAKKLGVDYVMKWRSDMLPTNLDINFLFTSANYLPPKGMKSRIVTCAFRNLSVNPDWFSSIPDYFSFGHIDIMELLWGDNEFNYSKMYNTPQGMIAELGEDWMVNKDIACYYCAESELYAFFKHRIQRIANKIMTHEEILKSHFTLIDHNSLSIIWFGSNGLFRPIISLNFPWWNTRVWNGKKKVVLITAGYPQTIFWKYFSKYIVYFITKFKNYEQKKLLNKFLALKK
jgi:hypothetical protein